MSELVSAGYQYRGHWRKSLYVSAAVAGFNIVLYLAGYWLEILARPTLFDSGPAQPGLISVISLSLGSVLAAFLLYRILEEHLSRPLRVFVAAAVPIVVFSFIAPTAMAAWSRNQIALFELMHIAVFTAVLVALWEWRPRPV